MIRDLETQETMRLSRVPVSSLDRHALVYDSGGLLGDLPLASSRMLRSSRLKLSAFHAARTQASVSRFSPCSVRRRSVLDHNVNPVSELHTGPADLLHPAPDIRFLLPAGFATGPVASRYPRKDLHLLDDNN